MTRMSVRLMLLVVCIGAIGYAAYQTWSSERESRLNESSSHRFDAAARATTVGIAELRAAQQAYVAAGQGVDFWFARVSSIVKDLHDKIASLKSIATAPEATTALDEAGGALQDFEQMDKRARDYARGREMTRASDLVFTDGFDLTRKAGDAVERAVTAELAARDGATAGLGRSAAIALTSAALIVVVALALLVPMVRPREYKKDDVIAGLAALTAKPAITVPRVKEPPKLADPDLDDFRVIPVPKPAPTPERRVDLGGMASLCVDLARITDTRALPALLERAAAILDASGVVVWIADPDGRELSPILVHGYPAQLATRLGTIQRDAENVTASAYRTGLLQTMKGDMVSSGAVAAPLVTAGGCVGVMAAEVKNGGEQQDSLLAAATIISSQLATLVGPPSARAKAEAAG
jgi:PAS domain-containing protein